MLVKSGAYYATSLSLFCCPLHWALEYEFSLGQLYPQAIICIQLVQIHDHSYCSFINVQSMMHAGAVEQGGKGAWPSPLVHWFQVGAN